MDPRLVAEMGVPVLGAKLLLGAKRNHRKISMLEWSRGLPLPPMLSELLCC